MQMNPVSFKGTIVVKDLNFNKELHENPCRFASDIKTNLGIINAIYTYAPDKKVQEQEAANFLMDKNIKFIHLSGRTTDLDIHLGGISRLAHDAAELNLLG